MASTNTSTNASTNEQTSANTLALEETILRNPLLKAPLLVILKIAEREGATDRQALWEAANAELNAELKKKSLLQDTDTLIDILIRRGGLCETVFVDGVAYEGSIDDLSKASSENETETENQSLSSTSDVRQELTITEAGKAIRDRFDSQKLICDLIAAELEHQTIYHTLLKSCVKEGCSRFQLQDLLKDEPVLQPDPKRGVKTLYINYFLDRLEGAGALVWDSKWVTTEAGKAVVETGVIE
ncbi:MAG: hypothetical protein LBL27_02275 [Coriobacteriales bacterium]|nr:hypothetical protein [Coriobacteriales bacterium]